MVERAYGEGLDWNDQVDREDTAHIDHRQRCILFYAPSERIAIGLIVPPNVEVNHLRVANAGVDETDAFFLSLGANIRENGEQRQGSSSCALEWIGYRPGSDKFWWLEGMLYGGSSTGRLDDALFPILTVDRRTYGSADCCRFSTLRSDGRREEGRAGGKVGGRGGGKGGGGMTTSANGTGGRKHGFAATRNTPRGARVRP